MIENIYNGENYTIQVPDTLALVPGDNQNIDMKTLQVSKTCEV